MDQIKSQKSKKKKFPEISFGIFPEISGKIAVLLQKNFGEKFRKNFGKIPEIIY